MRWIPVQMSSNSNLDSELIADWLELTALSKTENASSIDRMRSVASEILETPLERIDVSINVMRRRSEVLQSSYPFEIRAVGIVRRSNWSSFPYTYLLRATSGVGHEFSLSDDEDGGREVTFENLVAIASRVLLGPGSQSIRFGFPSGDRPAEFPAAIEWLSQKMGIKSGKAYRPPRRKDGGVDVVAWRPFRDKRNGFPVFLIQATCERNFLHKVQDIDLRLWSGWLSLDSDPVSLLAVPNTIGPGEEWNELSSRVVMLERLRLCELLTGYRVNILNIGRRETFQFSEDPI